MVLFVAVVLVVRCLWSSSANLYCDDSSQSSVSDPWLNRSDVVDLNAESGNRSSVPRILESVVDPFVSGG